MAHFRVLEGIAYLPNPDFKPTPSTDPDDPYNLRDFKNPERHRVYKKGDIVESSRDLARVFPNKFVQHQEQEIPEITPARRAAVDTMIQEGLWKPDDRAFLETLSEDGFARIQRLKTLPEPPDGKEQSILGTDVTSRFQQAYDHGFKVYRNPAGKHQIVPPGEKKPINLKPLEAEEVEKTVAKILKEKS